MTLNMIDMLAQSREREVLILLKLCFLSMLTFRSAKSDPSFLFVFPILSLTFFQTDL